MVTNLRFIILYVYCISDLQHTLLHMDSQSNRKENIIQDKLWFNNKAREKCRHQLKVKVESAEDEGQAREG